MIYLSLRKRSHFIQKYNRRLQLAVELKKQYFVVRHPTSPSQHPRPIPAHDKSIRYKSVSDERKYTNFLANKPDRYANIQLRPYFIGSQYR